MEVKLDKRYPVAAGVEQAWAVLSDVHATAACMPGARITEQIDGTRYKGTVRSKVGPAVMAFQGEIEVLALDAAERRMQMVGKGADKSGSSASMNLTARVEPEADGSAVLVGQAVIVVAGKLAQFGSRLLVPVSDAMLSQFADNFRAAAAAAMPPARMPAGADTAPATTAGPASDKPLAAEAAAPGAPPPPAPPHAELDALSLAWLVIKRWFAGLFGRGRGR